MRTTLTIDDDVLSAVKERARHESRTAGEVLSDLARQALTAPPPNEAEDLDGFERTFGFRPLPRRGGFVTSETVRRLMDEDPYG